MGHAHYYSVTFDEGSNASGVKIEVTPTEHAVLVRFTFPEGSENRNVIFDDVFTNGQLTFDDDNKTFRAYTCLLYTSFAEHPDHFDPRQYLGDGRAAIKGMVEHKIKDVLGCEGKA